jgi:hypothetical protein
VKKNFFGTSKHDEITKPFSSVVSALAKFGPYARNGGLNADKGAAPRTTTANTSSKTLIILKKPVYFVTGYCFGYWPLLWAAFWSEGRFSSKPKPTPKPTPTPMPTPKPKPKPMPKPLSLSPSP